MNFDLATLFETTYIYYAGFFLTLNLIVWTFYKLISRVLTFFSKISIFVLFCSLFISLRVPLFFLKLSGSENIIGLANAFLVAGLVYLCFKILDLLLIYLVLKENKQFDLPPLLHNIITGLLYLIIILVILRTAFNINLTPLLATSAVFSMVVGLALQDILKNLFSGIILSLEQPFKVGDWIEVNNKRGQVIDISWRTTKIKTPTHDCMIIPNDTISKAELINFYQPTKLHMEKISISASYNSPPSVVKTSLMKVIKQVKRIRRRPAPDVFLLGYHDFSIEYEMRFWISDFDDRVRIKNEILSLVWYQFRRDNITIPYPVRNINLHNIPQVSEEERKSLQVTNLLPILREVPILKPLSPEELLTLAEQVHIDTYTENEVIFTEGEAGDSFFIIRQGEVSVSKTGVDNELYTITRLSAGTFFGEVALLTGGQRSATVTALIDSELIVVDRDTFQQILNADPSIAEELSQVLYLRQQETRDKLEVWKDKFANSSPKLESSHNLLKRIRHFFGLSKGP